MASLSNFDQRQTFFTEKKEKPPKPLTSLRAENCKFVIPQAFHSSDSKLTLTDEKVQAVTGSQVLKAVSVVFGIPIEDLKGPRRARRVARPRQVAMYFCRLRCHHMSLPMIGVLIGGRDHTTIMHGCRQIEGLLCHDEDLRLKCSEVAALLEGLGE